MLMLMSNADADAYALASLTKTICANFDPFVSLLKYHIDKDLAYQTPLPLLGKLIKKSFWGVTFLTDIVYLPSKTEGKRLVFPFWRDLLLRLFFEKKGGRWF